MNKYYGQWETDRIIEQYFTNQNQGGCIEVGAYNGIKGSNTKYFEDLGWDCICIEPNPSAFQRLEYNRPKSINLQIACGEQYCEFSDLTIYQFISGTESSLTSLKTDPRLIRDYDTAIYKTSSIPVKVYTLGSIIDSIWLMKEDIDFISIDTEGTELSVLKGLRLDLGSVNPKLLVVENNYNDHDIEEYLLQFDYRLDKRYRVNDFYVRKSW